MKKARILPTANLAPRAIQSEEELDAYFSHDELECLICGKRVKGLYRHLPMAHGVTARDYKLAHNIPMTRGLVGAATKAKMQVSAETTCAKLAKGGFRNLARAREVRAATTDTRQAWPSYLRAEHGAKMVDSPNHPSNILGVDELVCSCCGGAVYVAASASLALQCRVRCDSCKQLRKGD